MKMSCCQWGHSNEIKASWCMGKIEVVQFCTVLYYALCCVPVRPKPDQGGLKWEVLKETRSREKIQHQLHLRQCCLEAAGAEVPVTLKSCLWKTVPRRRMCLGDAVLALWVNKATSQLWQAGQRQWRWLAESPAWFPRPRYASEKSLVKLEGQTKVRFVVSVVMSVFFFSSFVSCL